MEEPYANLHKIEENIVNEVDANFNDDTDNNMKDFLLSWLDFDPIIDENNKIGKEKPLYFV